MATPVIVPAILTSDVNEFKASMDKYAAFAKRIQIDISDGTMVGSRTIDETAVVIPEGVAIDIHLMATNPERHLDALIALKPSLVILHAEVQVDLLPLFTKLKSAGIRTGVAFLKQTYPGRYKVYVDVVDHALIFAGELGVQGSVADLLQVEKARIIRGMRKDIEIGWDGGATLSNVRAIFQSGITVVNVGNAIKTAADAKEAYSALVAEAEKPGVM